MRFILLFLLFIPGLCQAQFQHEITDRFNGYFSLKEQGGYTEFDNYLPEELIRLMPEAQLAASITQTFENPAFGIRVEDGKIESISNQVVLDKTGYVTVRYSYLMTVTMNEDSDFGMFDFILQSLLNTVPEDQVEADAANGTIVVRQTSLMIAIKKPKDTWRFMEINDQLLEAAEKILPGEVLASL